MIYFTIIFLRLVFVPTHCQYISQSLVVLSNEGNQFVPLVESAQFLSSRFLKLLKECINLCHNNIQCRVFDYGANLFEECHLFEGDTENVGSILPSLMSNAIVGTIKLTPSLFTEYDLPCSSFCNTMRYLTCNINFRCQCLEHTYWNPSLRMYLAQSPLRGAVCDQSMNMCREDLNYTCLQFNQCGPLSLLSGTTLADKNSTAEDNSTLGIRFPAGITLFNESLFIADSLSGQIIQLSNVNSNEINKSILIPNIWPDGRSLYLPYDIFIDSFNLYVSDSGNNRIDMFYSMGTACVPLIVINGSAAVHGSALNQLWGPYGMAIDRGENLIVTDMYNNRVMRWVPNATSGEVIAGSNIAGHTSMDLNFPNGLFLDKANSSLYVTDTANHRVQLFNLTGPVPYNGTTVAGRNGVGFASNQLNLPCGIWVSKKSGTMYIVDGFNHRIQRWKKGATSGVTIAGDPNGNSGINDTMLNNPTGIAINVEETQMYISDTYNTRIQRFNLI